MGIERKVESFLTLAGDDLAAAKALQKTFPRHAAFHLSQAAEKAIKAVLTAEGLAFNASHHQLGRLVAGLLGDHPWRADLMALDKHTAAATATRYPTPGGALPASPSQEQLRADVAELEALLPELADWCREP